MAECVGQTWTKLTGNLLLKTLSNIRQVRPFFTLEKFAGKDRSSNMRNLIEIQEFQKKELVSVTTDTPTHLLGYLQQSYVPTLYLLKEPSSPKS